MHVSPLVLNIIEIFGIGFVCLFVITRTIDLIFGGEYTGRIFYDLIWEIVLRNILLWCVALWTLGAVSIFAISLAKAIYQTWSELLGGIAALIVARLLVWAWWWLLDPATHATVRTTIKKQLKERNIIGWKRFIHWWLHWGEYEGTWKPSPSAGIVRPFDTEAGR